MVVEKINLSLFHNIFQQVNVISNVTNVGLPATYLVMYSSVTGSSTVSLCDWHSTLLLLMRILASAVSPANAIMTWSSSRQIFCTVRSSCSFATAFFSTPSTTTPGPRTPTAGVTRADCFSRNDARSFQWDGHAEWVTFSGCFEEPSRAPFGTSSRIRSIHRIPVVRRSRDRFPAMASR